MTKFDLRAQHPVLLEALMAHQAFRQLGFPADNLFFSAGHDSSGVYGVQVLLRWGGRQFVLTIGMMPGVAYDDINNLWRTLVEQQPNYDAAEFDALWEESTARREFVTLAVSLKAKGIELPITTAAGMN